MCMTVGGATFAAALPPPKTSGAAKTSRVKNGAQRWPLIALPSLGLSPDFIPLVVVDTRAPASARAVEPVARVPETGDDEAVLVEPAVDGRGDDVDVGMIRVNVIDPLGRGDETDQHHRARAGVLDGLEGRDARVAGREHRIEHDRVSLIQVA